MNSFTNTLETYLVNKAPALPKGLKDLLVTIFPWGIILFCGSAAVGLLGAIGAIGYFGAVGMFTNYNLAGMVGTNLYLVMIFSGINIVLSLLALPGLFRRKKSGWVLMYYSIIISAIGSILSLNILSAIISFVISAYLLFQVKSYYI